MTRWKDRKVQVQGTAILLDVRETAMNDLRVFPGRSDQTYPGHFWIDEDETEALIRALIDVFELPIAVVPAGSKKKEGGKRKARERALVVELKEWFRVEGLTDEARKAHIYAAIDTALQGGPATCSSGLCMILRDIVEAVEKDERGTPGT